MKTLNFFREYEGTYTAIVYSVKQLWSASNDTDNKEAVTGIPSKDSLNQLNDTMVFNLLNEK